MPCTSDKRLCVKPDSATVSNKSSGGIQLLLRVRYTIIYHNLNILNTQMRRFHRCLLCSKSKRTRLHERLKKVVISATDNQARQALTRQYPKEITFHQLEARCQKIAFFRSARCDHDILVFHQKLRKTLFSNSMLL